MLRSIQAEHITENEYTPIQPGGSPDPLAHLSGPRSFYRRLLSGDYQEVTSADVPGSEYWPDWQRAQSLLPETLYLHTRWSVTNYYAGETLIYTERA
jgi:hypothetical protein